ncbi:MAG: hydrogenase nickel incorporation protein HypB [Candidatus Marinimicrobia bacterium]|nr:hydrogenase nickel incorporation protein HypB [Candidatus Neomarinimicrobiota bacterium]MCF7828467.1 hydrogenase nickel incorporation protein HypB [Candidatus Neomarinimicrobiota bacterium]MCF7881957.1 hydrogenase nickel incorporation protein HypB [Candidatus Neomarinimicrobiota bacterium]
MCDTCGCGEGTTTIQTPGEAREHAKMHAEGIEHSHNHDHEHDHDHNHSHGHSHDHGNSHTTTIDVETDVLRENNLLAERNRGIFETRKIFALNLVSSPGSGKTTLLEKTVEALRDDVSIAVIEGDQQSMQDADRIDKTGVDVVQVNTGKGCHLDAKMVNDAIQKLELPDESILMIENVGNLVCPSLFDLGEHHKVVIISVTEGQDKPVKYPTMFAESSVCVINKIDLLPYVDFDVEACKDYARQVNPDLTFFELSATTSEGMDAWLEWVKPAGND